MASHAAGRAGEARTWLDRAIQWLDEAEQSERTDAANPRSGAESTWSQRLELRLLTSEAKSLMATADD